MKSIVRLVALTLSSAVLVLPAAAHAAPADHAERAGAKKFGTIAKAYGGRQEACKTLLPNGKQFKVFTRVVTGRGMFGVGLIVFRDGEETARAETPITSKGRTSKAVSVKFPKSDETYELVASQFEGGSGGGAPVSIKKIKKC